MPLNHRAATAAAAAFCLLALTACDPQRISELQPGVSTEADVRDRFGAPENVWDEPGGARTFEYNRQPAGQVNYMITIGPDGRMAALQQVLTPENFARVQPGTGMDAVRRLLGKPAKVAPFPLQNETHATWRYLQPPNQPKVFTVVYGPEQRVLRTQTGDDLEEPEFKGGR
jgi:hypothetical protein